MVRYDRDDDGLLHVDNKGRSQTFEVDRVFTDYSSQIEVRVKIVICAYSLSRLLSKL